jgi:YHS domain-containing protein
MSSVIPTAAQTRSQPSAVEQSQFAADSQSTEGHDMQMAREVSGTAWLPDSTPMYAVHAQRGAWLFMAHENAFVQFFHESGNRGGDQVGSINWAMGMAQRNVGSGRLMFRGMFSAEPVTIGGCGYPDLLASGEQCNGQKIHDRQHPHDLTMELAAEYDAPLKGSTHWQAYGGPAGEPALGPVAFPHRLSAMPNPLAPIGHHWLDSTHVSFGVVTAGLYGARWKAEGSVFNGREPDQHRTDFDFGPLDSVSGRVWFLPTANLAMQVSAGRLKEAEAAEGAGPRQDVDKITASAAYNRVHDSNVWASTVAWGRNAESGHATNAVLFETSVALRDQDTWFGRFEVVGKTADDLDVEVSPEVLTVSKLQGGYTRYTPVARRFKAGVGVSFSVGFVPKELEFVYGSRANFGVGVFLTLRPAVMAVASHAGPGAPGGGMVMVQTAFDPTKLSCSPPIDPKSASTATFQGKTYYFCSEKERNDFLKDPAMSLSMMPPKQ